jgi:ABC-type transporter Mla subunit MlaD
MNEKLGKRLQELKAEFDAGQEVMAQLETRQNDLRNTLLRISGAIQVLEELVAENGRQVDDNIPVDSAS